jgi:predicted nucleic-acid-binding Zn-ribbon protein
MGYAMAKAEECEFFSDGQCKALIKEGTMTRDESCLNSNRSSCCYQCARRVSCEMSCDYLDDPKTYADRGTTASQKGDCPKCGGEMIEGVTTNYVRILKQGDLSGDLVAAFYCRECGFVEFYKKASSKEPWRWKRQSEEQSKKPEQAPKEEDLSSEATRRKMVR